jgi:aminoglycoside phosphotransferase family enzyme
MTTDLRHTLAEVVAFLSQASTYRDRTQQVECIETHFAWVFLTDAFAYKFHKPIKFHEIDFTTLDKRKANCERAIVLNRRLCDDVYLDLVPLVIQNGRLSLNAEGEPVEWLIKMRRLPSEKMLDRRLQSGAIDQSELVPVTRRLVDFYRVTPAVAWDSARFLSKLTRGVLRATEQLSCFPAEIDIAEADTLAAAQLGFIELNRSELSARIEARRVVDAHGDLRPEHVLPGPRPQIIDCLEFSDSLRFLDTAEEICGLAIECERYGRPEIGDLIIDLYKTESDDACSDALLGFYRSYRALSRAVLCAWHLEEPLYAASSAMWIERTKWYIRTGMSHLHRSGAIAARPST